MTRLASTTFHSSRFNGFRGTVSDMTAVSRRAEIAARAAGLADPLRLAVLDMLAATGPRTASEIGLALGVSGSRLGNHLAKLRQAELVTVTRHGRQAIYELASPRIRDVLGAFAALPGVPAAGGPNPDDDTVDDLALARTCYGHLGGRVGVGLFDHLVRMGAIEVAEDPMGDISVRPEGAAFLDREWGVDLGRLSPGRRRLAYPCLDWSEHRPHLGGVLADALLAGLLDKGLLARRSDSRILDLTRRGRKILLPMAGG